MKKGILIIVLVLAAVIAWFYLSPQKQTNTAPEAPAVTQVGPPAVPANDLPNLPLTKLDQTQVQAKDLKGKTVLIFFDPDCDHCQRQANDMQQHLPAFANYTVCFFSSATMEKMKQFFMEYNLSGQNIFFAYAPGNLIFQELGPVQTPSTYIYSEQGKLIKSFNGETSMEKILPLL